VVWVTLLASVLTHLLNWAAARASRSLLNVDLSKTLGGTLSTRTIAWVLLRPNDRRPSIDPDR